jgi:2-C-methyl-D-erythritol 4-phosphate cytidylyltransferase
MTFRISLFLLSWIIGFASVSSFVTPTTAPSRPSFLKRHGTADANSEAEAVDMGDVGFVVLAGGKGSRMKAGMPKQFLELLKVPILHHSLDLFLERLPAFLTSKDTTAPPFVVLVMDPSYQPEYQPIVDRYAGRLVFANPGLDRQGSCKNGLDKLVEVSQGKCQIVAVHDSARPLVTIAEVCNVVRDCKEHGAAVLGVPCKATIKESEDGETVLRTIPRARLWEVHTPQVIKIETLQRGFAKVEAEGLEVTDDVSIVEALGETVKLTLGEYTNLKITTPEDMDVATAILLERKSTPVNMLADK